MFKWAFHLMLEHLFDIIPRYAKCVGYIQIKKQITYTESVSNPKIKVLTTYRTLNEIKIAPIP